MHPHPICYVEIKKKETVVLAPTRLLTLLVIGVSGVGFAGTAIAQEPYELKTNYVNKQAYFKRLGV